MIAMFLAASAATYLVIAMLLYFERWHAWATHDHIESGPQKFHALATPRIGGGAIVLGMLAALLVGEYLGDVDQKSVWLLCLATTPAFLAGFVEDLTKKVGAEMRLWASFLSALLCILVFDVSISSAAIPWLDKVLAWYPIALVFTVVAIGGVAHAMNIVDGYNGLSGMLALLMSTAIGFVSWQVGDAVLVSFSLMLAGATVGFLAWNWPRGRMFAGDGPFRPGLPYCWSCTLLPRRYLRYCGVLSFTRPRLACLTPCTFINSSIGGCWVGLGARRRMMSVCSSIPPPHLFCGLSVRCRSFQLFCYGITPPLWWFSPCRLSASTCGCIAR
jgi:hypothetical protein